MGFSLLAGLCFVLCIFLGQAVDEITPGLYEERVVFQIEEGDIEFAFYVDVAPVTVAHIFELAAMGLYTSSSIFRVDKGFLAQTQEVTSRKLPMNEEQKKVATKSLPLEVKEGVRHHEGVLSMARANSPTSGTSAFFICYGTSPHLDMQYAVFGRVTKGMDVLHSLEALPTHTEGTFRIPYKDIVIFNTYWYRIGSPTQLSLTSAAAAGPAVTTDKEACAKSMQEVTDRLSGKAHQLQEVQKKCLTLL